jgi:hypothetical protein
MDGADDHDEGREQRRELRQQRLLVVQEVGKESGQEEHRAEIRGADEERLEITSDRAGRVCRLSAAAARDRQALRNALTPRYAR